MNNIQGEVIDKYWRWKKTHTTCWELQNFLCDLIGNDLVEEIEGGIVAESHSRTEVLREFVAYCHSNINFPEEVDFAQQVKNKVDDFLKDGGVNSSEMENNEQTPTVDKINEMKPNNLNYLKLVQDMNDMLENDFCMDMDCKLHLHDGRDKNSFTQEEAQQMADLIGKLYTLSHYWYCHCGLGKGYGADQPKTTSTDIKEIKKEFDVIVNLMIDWNYGTIYKQYDREETTEILAEDTLKYTKDLWELVAPHLSNKSELKKEAVREGEK